MDVVLICFVVLCIDVVLIDFDGMMVDIVDDFMVGLNGMFVQFGVLVMLCDEVIGYVGKGFEYLIQSVLKLCFLVDEVYVCFDDVLVIYQSEYVKINGCYMCFYLDVVVGFDVLCVVGIWFVCVMNKLYCFVVELFE